MRVLERPLPHASIQVARDLENGSVAILAGSAGNRGSLLVKSSERERERERESEREREENKQNNGETLEILESHDCFENDF